MVRPIMGSGVPESQLRRGENRQFLRKKFFSDWNELVFDIMQRR